METHPAKTTLTYIEPWVILTAGSTKTRIAGTFIDLLLAVQTYMVEKIQLSKIFQRLQLQTNNLETKLNIRTSLWKELIQKLKKNNKSFICSLPHK